MKSIKILFLLAAITVFGFTWLRPAADPTEEKSPATKAKRIERGKYLVMVCACNDCHSPKVFTPMGPIPDTTKLLSGHPGTSKVPEVPKGVLGPEGWGALASNDFTAWSGPWGISFTKNLTPDSATGLGSWTEDMFLRAIRTGKDMGEGRAILPPMPWTEYRHLTDEDLKSIFAFLRTLPAVDNAVPDPISPTGESIPSLKK